MSPADGTAGVGHLLQLQAAGVAQTHVSTGVDDRVHRVLVADGALVGPRLSARRERRGLGEAGGGAGDGPCAGQTERQEGIRRRRQRDASSTDRTLCFLGFTLI